MTITPKGDSVIYDKDGSGIGKSADLVVIVGPGGGEYLRVRCRVQRQHTLLGENIAGEPAYRPMQALLHPGARGRTQPR